MLLNNFMATLYDSLPVVSVNNNKKDGAFASTYAGSVPSTHYNSNGHGSFYPYKRGIVFGSGTTPPRKQIIK